MLAALAAPGGHKAVGFVSQQLQAKQTPADSDGGLALAAHDRSLAKKRNSGNQKYT